MAFNYRSPVSSTDADCKTSFARTFQHDDWVDGQDVVQAERTSDEEGFNARFHKIEHDLDALAKDLKTAIACINTLRAQVALALEDIQNQFNAKPLKETKEGKDFKDSKDAKDGKDQKDTKDTKDAKDAKDTKDSKDTKDGKDSKDGKDHKDTKDAKDVKDTREKILGAIEKQFDNFIHTRSRMSEFLWRAAPAAPTADTTPEPEPVRAFIRPSERPEVGARVLAEVAAEADALLARLGGTSAETERSPEHRAKPEAPEQRSEGSAEGDMRGDRMKYGLLAGVSAARAELDELAADVAETERSPEHRARDDA
jgi:hypothetical protein